MTTPIAAANAYANFARMTEPRAGFTKTLGDPAGEGQAGSFGAMLKDALATVVEAGHKSDAQAASLAAGKADMVDLVTAVSESETAISTLVSVRDRVIQAYQQIMQMPI
jgi:flagellar hook-basal body complex protein FliE